jgi:hypothetical protein
VVLAWHCWYCRYRSYNLSSCVVLRNKPPRWNQAVGAYCLNFGGRVAQASVKNFQLVSMDNMVGARWVHAVHAVLCWRNWGRLPAHGGCLPAAQRCPWWIPCPAINHSTLAPVSLRNSCSKINPTIPTFLAACRSAQSCSLARWQAMPSPWTTATP